MTTTILSSGFTGSGLIVSSGNELLVLSGGLAEDTRLLGGGVLLILPGGSAVGAVDSGGGDRVFSGGSTMSTTILSGGIETVASGGLASGSVISNGGQQIVSGTVISAVVDAGGVQVALGGASLLSGTVIQRGGRVVLSNFFAVDFPTVERGGYIDIPGLAFSSFGLAAFAGTSISIQQGVFTDTISLSGSYGADQFVMLPDSDGGTEVERAGAVASSGALITNGDADLVASGQATTAARVAAGGVLVVVSGGTAVRTTDIGGDDIVLSGGSTTSTTVKSGGMETVLSGGLASGSLISNGGQEIVSGTVIGAVVHAGGVQVAVGGASLLSGTVIQSGGRIVLSNFFAVDFPTLERGGYIDIPGLTFTSYGLATFTGSSISVQQGIFTDTIGLAGGYGSDLFVMIPDSEGGTEVERVAATTTIASGVTGSDLTISSAFTLRVVAGGRVISTTVLDGGALRLFSGGKATATLVAGHGVEVVSLGGVASGTTVLDSGREVVASGGVTSQLTVSAGGSVNVVAGGKVIGLGLASGATLIDNGEVLLGTRNLKGTLSGAGQIVEFAANGRLVLSTDGGAFDGRVVVSSGRVELAVAGAIGSGKVGFFGGAANSQTLQIDGPAAPAPGGTFANTISNFNAANKTIDLHGLAFVAGASATLSGSTLTLVDGGKSYKFHLAGLVGKSFSVAADGSGGTQITAHSTAAFAQAAAGLAAPGPALQSPVSGYGGEPQFPFRAGAAGGRD